MRASDQTRPETLLAAVNTFFTDMVILPPAVLAQEERPFQPPLLAACRACGSGFRFLNNGFHLLFRLGLPLQGYIEIVCLVRPFLRPQEHTADDLSGHHLQGLTISLIHGK